MSRNAATISGLMVYCFALHRFSTTISLGLRVCVCVWFFCCAFVFIQSSDPLNKFKINKNIWHYIYSSFNLVEYLKQTITLFIVHRCVCVQILCDRYYYCCCSLFGFSLFFFFALYTFNDVPLYTRLFSSMQKRATHSKFVTIFRTPTITTAITVIRLLTFVVNVSKKRARIQ